MGFPPAPTIQQSTCQLPISFLLSVNLPLGEPLSSPSRPRSSLIPLPETDALGCQSRSHLEPGAASHHKWVLPGGEKGRSSVALDQRERTGLDSQINDKHLRETEVTST